jgi:hypothetical protein
MDAGTLVQYGREVYIKEREGCFCWNLHWGEIISFFGFWLLLLKYLLFVCYYLLLSLWLLELHELYYYY